MKLDLSKFKKTASSKTHTTLKHLDGHELHIKHSSLSPKMRAQLHELPQAMADGGEVEEVKAPEAPQPPAPVTINLNTAPAAPPVAEESMGHKIGGAVRQSIADTAGAFKTVGGGVVGPVLDQAKGLVQGLAGVDPNAAPQQQPSLQPSQQPAAPSPQQVQQMAAAPQQPNPQMQMAANEASALVRGIGEQEAGIKQQAAAQAMQAAGEMKALESAAMQAQRAQDTYNQKVSELDKQRNEITKAVEEHQIDPNRFMNNMNTFGQIRTAIGLFLGGIGAGSRGENPALQMLQTKINQDIDAQKAMLGKKENLLNANMRQYGNLKDAQDMTRAMINDRVSMEVKKAAAQAGSPMAQAQAQMLLGKLHQETAGLMQQVGMRQALMSSGPGSLSQQDPAKFVRFVVPKEQQAAAYKEVQEAQNMSKAKENILSAFNQLTNLNTVGNRTTSPLQTARQVHAIKDPIVAALSKETAGRFTEQDAKMLDALFPSAGDTAETITKKRKQIDHLISEKMHFPVLSSYNLDIEKFQSTTGDQAAKLPPQQQQWVQWAKSVESNPQASPADRAKAQLLLKKVGLK